MAFGQFPTPDHQRFDFIATSNEVEYLNAAEKEPARRAEELIREVAGLAGGDELEFLRLIVERSKDKLVVVEDSKHLHALNALEMTTDANGLFDDETSVSIHADFYEKWLAAATAKKYMHPDSETEYERKFRPKYMNKPEIVAAVTAALAELRNMRGKGGIFLMAGAPKKLRYHEGMHALQSLSGFGQRGGDTESLDHQRMHYLLELQTGRLLVSLWKDGRLGSIPENGEHEESTAGEADYWQMNKGMMDQVMERLRSGAVQ
jgi:hypothetical protein